MISVNAIIDHAAQAVARLASQFRNAPLLKGLIAAISGEVQSIEDAFNDLRVQIRDIDEAEDDRLDQLAKLVGAPVRGPLDNLQYRERVKAQILINKSTGRSANIYAISKRLVAAWNIDSQPKVTESVPACFSIGCDGPTALRNDDGQARELAQALNGSRANGGATAAGVRAIVLSRPDTVANDNFFRFAGGSGASAGFGVGKFRGAYDK